jgi:hypothetical protein
MRSSVALSVLTALAVATACASSIPKAELDRCQLGTADGNDSFQVRQGAACRMVAQRLAADEKPGDALGYARKSCELEDAHGCEQYLALARAQPTLPSDELLHARAAGEKACAGIVVGADGTDARPAICAKTAELYLDVEPKSPSDAGRLYARACRLGDDRSCAKAKSLGADTESKPVIVAAKASPPSTASTNTAPPPPPTATAQRTPTPTTTGVAHTVSCHEMRQCVALDVQQRNTTEVVGTLTNKCDRTVSCTWCPAKGDQVDRNVCRATTLNVGESRAGREAGLWYDGYTAMAYDCMDSTDDRNCSAL